MTPAEIAGRDWLNETLLRAADDLLARLVWRRGVWMTRDGGGA